MRRLRDWLRWKFWSLLGRCSTLRVGCRAGCRPGDRFRIDGVLAVLLWSKEDTLYVRSAYGNELIIPIGGTLTVFLYGLAYAVRPELPWWLICSVTALSYLWHGEFD